MRGSLQRWLPHVPLALALLPLGLLLVDGALRAGLGLHPLAFGIRDLEQEVRRVSQGPLLELALGVLVLAMSAGVALRSELAWVCSVSALTAGLLLRALTPFRTLATPLFAYELLVLVLLVYHRRAFSRRSVVTSTAFALVVLLTFLMWAVLGTLRLGTGFQPPVQDLEAAAYFVVVTFATVGFGDITPASSEARLFVMTMIVLGILVGGIALGAVLVPVLEGRMQRILARREEHVDRSDHYVVAGDSPLARNAVQELERREQKVTLVITRASDDAFHRDRDVLVGDPTDLGVLRTAGTARARAVLALSTDDAENGFVVLGVNELAPAVTTVAAVNDPANESRIRRTQPSLILSLQVLGGELLAMALTGEKVDEAILRRVLQLNPGAPDGRSP